MPKVKTKMITVKVRPEVRDDFKIAAKLIGSSGSGLLHVFIIQTIREQRERDPEAFTRRLLPVKTVKLKASKQRKKA